jgi:hypothetical protein
MNCNRMPTRCLPLLLIFSLLYSMTAAANCLLPAPPAHIPDGHSANDQEMLAAIRTIKQYNEDVDEYTKCLLFEQKRNQISFGDQEAQRTEALNTLASVVERLNQQVRIYKARHS